MSTEFDESGLPGPILDVLAAIAGVFPQVVGELEGYLDLVAINVSSAEAGGGQQYELAVSPLFGIKLLAVGGVEIGLLGAERGLELACSFASGGWEAKLRIRAYALFCSPGDSSGTAEAQGQDESDSDAATPLLGVIELGLDINNAGSISAVASLSMPAFTLGQSGFVVTLDGLSAAIPAILNPDLVAKYGGAGVHVNSLSVRVPPALEDLGVSRLEAKNVWIGKQGLSGSLSMVGSGGVNSQSGGLQIDVLMARVELAASAFQAAEIEIQIVVPGATGSFDLVVDVDRGGSIGGRLVAKDGAIGTLEIPTVLSIDIAGVELRSGEAGLQCVISGSLRLTALKGAVDWPKLPFGGLVVDSRGHLSFEGTGLSAHEVGPFGLFGCQAMIHDFLLADGGNEETCARLTASVNLHPALKQGGSIDGLKIRWRTDANGKTHFLGLSFEGIAIEVDTPTVNAKASLKMYDDPDSPGDKVFQGEGGLNLKQANKRFDAKFRIGKRTNPKTGASEPYFLIFVDADLGDGIAISANLNLYGISLVAGWNQGPKKLPDQKWYAPKWEAQRGWYDAKPRGVSQLEKWGFQDGAMVIGAGVTIGTSDGGYTFAGRFLALFLLPGPVILLEGRANMLKKRSELANENAEPTFGALAAFDFAKNEITFGLDARFAYNDGGSVVTVAGSTEAYFSLNDPSKWHLYIGKDTPIAAQIAGRIFKIWDVSAYLMIDLDQGLRTGARFGFSKKANYKVVKIGVEVWIAAMVHISARPVHFHGEATLDGKAWLKVCGYGISLSVNSKLEADVFRPFRIAGKLKVAADLPWPLPDVKKQISLSWSPPAAPGAQPGSPAVTSASDWPLAPRPMQAITIGHTRATGAWRLERGAQLWPELADPNGMIALGTAQSEFDAPAVSSSDGWEEIHDAGPPSDLPRVPMDGRIQVTFARPMQDPGTIGVGAFNGGAVDYVDTIGDPKDGKASPVQARYYLREIELCRWSPERQVWQVVARSGDAPGTNLPAKGQSPAEGQLQVFGAWGPFSPMGPMPDVQAVDGGGKAETPQTACQRLWLLSNNPVEFNSHSSLQKPGDDLFTVLGSVTGTEVEAADLVLNFQGLPTGTMVESGLTGDGIAVSWTGEAELPIDDVEAAPALNLAGEPTTLLGDALLYWLDAATTTTPQPGSVPGGDGADGQGLDGNDGDDVNAYGDDDADGDDGGTDGGWDGNEGSGGGHTTGDLPGIAGSGMCITGLHAVGCGCSCFDLLVACCPRDELVARWPSFDDDDDGDCGGDHGHGLGDTDDDSHRSESDDGSDGSDGGGGDGHDGSNHEHDGEGDPSDDDDPFDAKSELHSLIDVVDLLHNLTLPFSRLVHIVLPPNADDLDVTIVGDGALVWRARRADTTWTDPVALTSVPQGGITVQGYGPLLELEVYCCGALWLQEVRVHGDPQVAQTSKDLVTQHENALKASIARWGKRSMVLWPDQAYRLRIRTEIRATPGGLLAHLGAGPKTVPLVEDAFFATAGPPGTSKPTPPAAPGPTSADAPLAPLPPTADGASEPPPAAPASEAIVRVLSTLDAYVASTVPAPVVLPTPQQQAESPGLYDGIESAADVIFGDDDVCVDFDADSIEWMYRLARRDLAMSIVGPGGAILSAPGLPPGGREARFGTWNAGDGPSDPTKPMPTGKLAAAWLEKVKPIAQAMGVDGQELLQLESLSMPGVQLPVGMRCEARLAPLLLRETFAPRPETEPPVAAAHGWLPPFPSGWSVSAPPGSEAIWLPVELLPAQVAIVGPGVGDAAVIANDVGNLDEAALLGREGGALVWAGVDGPLGALIDDPAHWRDVRASAWVGPRAHGACGLVARRSTSSSSTTSTSWYRLELDQDKAELRCIRRQGDTCALIGFANVKVAPSSTVLLSFEVREEGELLPHEPTGQQLQRGDRTRLRAWLGDRLLLDLQDVQVDRPAQGSIALWTWRQASASFADVRVENLAGEVPPVLRFPVQVAPASSLFDLLSSHDGFATKLNADSDLSELTGLTWGADITAKETNSWLYDAATWSETPSPPTTAETKACQALLERLRSRNLELAIPLEGVRVSTFEVKDALCGIVIESPMQLDWRRTTLVAAATGFEEAQQWQAASAVAIAAVSLAPTGADDEPAATLQVRNAVDLGGMVLERQTLGDPVLRAGVPAPLWTMPGPDQRSGPLWRMSPGKAALQSFDVIDNATKAWSATASGIATTTSADGSDRLIWLRCPAVSGLRMSGRFTMFPNGSLVVVCRSSETGGQDAPKDVRVHFTRTADGSRYEIAASQRFADGEQPLSNDQQVAGTGATVIPSPTNVAFEVLLLGQQLAVRLGDALVWSSTGVTCVAAGRTGISAANAGAMITELAVTTLGPWVTAGAGASQMPALLVSGANSSMVVDLHQPVGPFTTYDGAALAAPSRWTLDDGCLLQSQALKTTKGAGGTATSYAALPSSANASDVRVELRCGASVGGACGVALRWQGPDDHIAVLARRTADGSAVITVSAMQGGAPTPLFTIDTSAASEIAPAAWPAHVAVRIRDQRLDIWHNGGHVGATTVPASYSSGVALIAQDGDVAEFRDVVVWPLSLAERAQVWSTVVAGAKGSKLPGFFDGETAAPGSSEIDANAGLPGTSKGWASAGEVFHPTSGAAQPEMLVAVADLSALCIGVSVSLQQGRAGVVLASAPSRSLTLDIERFIEEDAKVGASWQLKLTQTPIAKISGPGPKPKAIVVASGLWPDCPDGWMRWTTWTRDGRLRACVNGIPLLDVPLNATPGLGDVFVGPGHIGVRVGWGAGVLFRDFGAWSAWDVADATTSVNLAAIAGVTVQDGLASPPPWDGAPETKIWAAATSATLVDGGMLALSWNRCKELAGVAPGPAGHIWIGLGTQGSSAAPKGATTEDSADVHLTLSGVDATPSLTMAKATQPPPALWVADDTLRAVPPTCGVLVLQRRGAELILWADGAAQTSLAVDKPVDGPWSVELGCAGHAPAAIGAIWTETPTFAAVARCARQALPAARGQSISILPAGVVPTSKTRMTWAGQPPDAAVIPWQSAELLRLRLRDKGGRTLHDAEFVAATSQAERLAGPKASLPTRLLRSADGTVLVALWPAPAKSPNALDGAKTLRVALRRVRDAATIVGKPKFAPAVPMESSGGDTSTIVASTMLRVIVPPPIIELPPDAVSITPIEP